MSLEALKTLVEGYTQKEHHSFSLLKRGFPKGALTEISGSGKCEFIVQFLAENSKLKVAWIEPSMTIFPLAFPQRNVQLKRLVFVQAGSEVSWATLQILLSQLFQVVVVGSPCKDLKFLRRLQLASEKSQASVIFCVDKPQSLWPLSMQVRISRYDLEEQLNIEVLRYR